MSYGIPILVGFFGLALSYFFCALLKKTKVLDAPDGARKQQVAPVGRLGGVGIALGALLAGFLLSAWQALNGTSESFADVSAWVTRNWQVCAFTAAAFLIGLLDDFGKAKTVPKLLGLFIAAIIVTVLGLYVSSFSTPWGTVEFAPALMAGSALWLLVFSNAANFMDGSNGLSVGCLAIMLLGLAAIGIEAETFTLNVWWLALFGAILGFLAHNLRGRLYVGDAGALGLGALFASQALASGLEVWTIATLSLPFLIDVLMTLVWRAKRGRNWLEAHLDHAYQRLIASGWSHLEAAVLYWGLSATAAVMAAIAAKAGGAAPFSVFWTLLIAGCVIWIRHRRTAILSDLSG
ncbi:MAG: hypothetical protein ABJH52_11610 [Henriciella sp.]